MQTIKDRLLKGDIFNKKDAIQIAEKACASKETFAELLRLFISNEYRIAQRAAWCVSTAVEIKPQLIYPYIKTLIKQLLRTDVHNAVVRNSTRILNQISISEEHHGEVMNACFVLAEKRETPIATKAFALSTLYKLCLLYPDIKVELQTIAEAHLDSESAAVKNVSVRIIAALHKTKSPGINHKSAKIK